jgi:carboxypeptidase C (cathepsin A)
LSVGAIPLYDDKGRKTAEIVCTSYILDGAPPSPRPVTFAMNGGPGSASIWLDLCALGPRIVDVPPDACPSTPVRLIDNPNSWLAFTDLVFIDAVGTGYSRYRAPRIALTLETEWYVGINGLVLVSPFLDGEFDMWGHHGDLNAMYWVGTLPSMAAAHLERSGKFSLEALESAERFASSEYLLSLTRGWSDPEGLERTVARVASLTGTDPAWVRRQGGRINAVDYLREVHRQQGTVSGLDDISSEIPEPFPWENRTDGIVLVGGRSDGTPLK